MTKRNENRPGYKKTKVGWIPEEWECYRLSEIANINPESLSGKTNGNYRFYYLDLSAIDEGLIKYPDNKIMFTNAPSRARRVIKKGDVLLATVRPNLKGFAHIDIDIPDVICSTGYAVIRVKESIDSKYLYYTLFTYETERYFYGCVAGSGYPALNSSELNYLRLPVPSLLEQKKIAEILSTWDRAIEQTRRLIEAKKRLKKGLMQQLLTGRMRFPEFGPPVKDPGETPVGWKRLRASEIFKNKSIKKHNHAHVLSVTQDQGVVLRSSLERKINMSFENTDTYKLVEPGDFVISLRSFQGGLEYSRLKGLVSPAYYVICSQKEICDDFYKHYFKSYRFIGHLAIAVIGIRDGKQISFSDFSFMKIPYPSHKEQRKIAAVLNACDLEIKQLTKQESALKKQKQGLMQKLLTGEIRVNKTS